MSQESAFIMTPFGAVPANVRVVASVHFRPMGYLDFWHSKNRSFFLQAAKLGEPTYLKVYDSVQYVPDTSALQTYQSGMAKPADIPMPVPVDAIVGDLMRKWQPYFGMTINSKKQEHVLRMPDVGIMPIAGLKATEQELAKMNRIQEAHCRANVEQADRFERNGLGAITDYHRDCLQALGGDEHARHRWYQPVQQAGPQKLSAVTGLMIPMSATMDSNISLIDHYIGNGLNPLDFGDTFIEEMLRKNHNIRRTVEKRLGITK